MSDRRAAYIDTSLLLAALFGEPEIQRMWLNWDVVLASKLVSVEAMRAFDRLKLLGDVRFGSYGRLVDELEKARSSFYELPVSEVVLERAAAPFPSVISTLDAIHLSTAIIWSKSTGQPVTFLTRDQQQSRAAKVTGLLVESV
jgi:predicted nucleic acid-binding protein